MEKQKKTPVQKLRQEIRALKADHAEKLDFLHGSHAALQEEYITRGKMLDGLRHENRVLSSHGEAMQVESQRLRGAIAAIGADMATERMDLIARVRVLEKRASQLGLDIRQL